MPSVIYVTAYSIQQQDGTGVPATENTTCLEYKLQHVKLVLNSHLSCPQRNN